MNTLTLRPYQQRFADDVVRALVKHKKTLAVAATGSGKTAVFMSLTQRALAKGLCVLVMTESTKIFEQLESQLHAFHIRAGLNNVPVWPGKAYIAMAQTLTRRDKLIAAFHTLGPSLLIINDEAHIGTSTKVLECFPDAQLIGFTATSDWRSAKHLPKLYHHCVAGPQPDELVQSGHLSPYRHLARVGADLDVLKIQSGEFTEASQEAAFGTQRVVTGLITDLKTVPYKKAMVFCASIKHATTVYGDLLKAGIPSVVVHSQTPYDMREFTNKDTINVCVSVGVLTKGYDFPRIDLICLVRATTSLPLYLQMIGRGSRTYPGKKRFTVLDYGKNGFRLGLWDMDRDWANMWKAQKRKKEGAAPIKMCPECEALVPSSATTCKHCGYIFPSINPIDNKENTKLVDLTAAYQTMIGRKISSLTAEELATYARIKNKKPYAIRIALRQAQLKGFPYIEQFGRAMGYKPGFARMKYEELTSDPTPIAFTDIILR